MKKITKDIEIKSNIFIPSNINLNQSIFLDIETTGFKAEYCSIYLIGLMYIHENTATIIQLFAENTDEEDEVLTELMNILSDFDTIITFNGNKFDIPFINKRLGHFKSDCRIIHHHLLDIYIECKNAKAYLPLNHFNQKSIENFLGINRDDQYDGGQLISVYKSYTKDGNPEKEDLLLLHNYEDVLHMLPLLSMLSFKDLRNEDYTINEITFDGESLYFKGSHNITLPQKIHLQDDYLYLTLESTIILGSLTLETQPLKYYHSDFKNYVILNENDQIIPKLLAKSLDKTSYHPATKDTCYTLVDGPFLRNINQESEEKLFYKEYKSKESYIKIDPTNLSKDWLGLYITSYMRSIN